MTTPDRSLGIETWSLRKLVTDLRAGRMTPARAFEEARARIEETDGDLHAWVEHLAEPDLTVGSGPLGGAPIGVKDIVDMRGLPTRCGSPLRASSAPAVVDAAIVDAWRHAGAVPIGKTHTTEFAYFAPGPTHNPAAPGHTPGGSSSGSAAAVASGQVPLAIGTQTAGSVTRPASYCGVASMVMGHGQIAMDGVVGLSPSLDSHGFFAATASDIGLAWSALTRSPNPVEEGTARAPKVLLWRAERLGVLEKSTLAVEEACRNLMEAGASVEQFPEETAIVEATAAHRVVMAYEAARERESEARDADQLSAPLANLLRTGEATTRQEYEEARRQLAAADIRITQAARAFDVVIGPASTGPAPEGLDATGDPVLSRAWQALGLPVVTVPGLAGDDGLPLGLQIVGSKHDEARLLAAATWIERALVPGGGRPAQ